MRNSEKEKIERENERFLLQVYQANYLALQNIKYEDFKKRALREAKQTFFSSEKSTSEIESNVEKILENNAWEVKQYGS